MTQDEMRTIRREYINFFLQSNCKSLQWIKDSVRNEEMCNFDTVLNRYK